ncbi:hypothetical protein PXH66_08905 [Synoicihabitans lomoniglobus]|uniref:Uncharacterized protein n=2 Tax=Synoicihabitans lomoniglobus TaxID=2909285 RepID=A0AAF0CS15_9BACT|nr:hypothetical protein PXH66_08905 [Opitutaceae bacterium LMO-M01]
MLHLANAELRVDLLDPTTEAARLGPRFCGGGYIWQIHDLRVGPLLSGPEGPESAPDPFNGHGLPESFRDRTRDGRALLWNEVGDEGLAPGAGRLGRDPSGVVLTAPPVWNIMAGESHLEFRTRHAAAGHDCEVVRRIELSDRRVRSHSTLVNRASAPLSLQWFAHPFFALDAEHHIALSVPPTTTLAADSGFTLAAGVITPARRYDGQFDGAFTLLGWPTGTPLDVRLSHPRLRDGIRFTTTFAPAECPLWMNGFTCSIEPYQTLDLAPGESREWTLTYDFGLPHGTA